MGCVAQQQQDDVVVKVRAILLGCLLLHMLRQPVILDSFVMPLARIHGLEGSRIAREGTSVQMHKRAATATSQLSDGPLDSVSYRFVAIHRVDEPLSTFLSLSVFKILTTMLEDSKYLR